MALGREAIYSALFSQISALLLAPAGPFNYAGRRPVSMSTLAAEQYPAFVLVETGEDYDRSRLFAPAKVTLRADLFIYSLQGEIPDESDAGALNGLADAVEDAIQAACGPTAQNTLGGLVAEAWILGRQVVTPGSYAQRQSEQVMALAITLPHSR
ncbi:MAG TPA: hypothetical protein VG848_04855 [Acetobacteraceae bacterium]|nr:hypothetical protein [Acetobacteraceae bacterium]